MLKKLLPLALALLVLPTALLVSAGTVTAAVETEQSLNERLLTTPELRAALEANGVTKAFPNTTDIPDIQQEGFVSSGRQWEAADGDSILIMLFSYKDGRDIPASFREEVLSGDIAKGYVEGAYVKSELLGDLEVISENDILHGFDATDRNDKVWEVAAVSFVRGNILGIVIHAASSNELDEVLSAFGGQTVKLPE